MQKAAFFAIAQGQHDVLPDTRAHGPYGKLLGVLYGEHGDRYRGGLVLDLQQQVEARHVGAVIVNADHVWLALRRKLGQRGVLGDTAFTGRAKMRDQRLGRSIPGAIEPQQKWRVGRFRFHLLIPSLLLFSQPRRAVSAAK
ncbi:hypothetical protein D3C85_1345170 [compost metagenome]